MKTEAIFTAFSFYALVLLFASFVVLISMNGRRWHILLTVFTGIVIGIIDMQSSEVSFSIVLLIGFGFFLGFINPSRLLRTALLLGIWVPIGALISMIVLNRPSTFWSEGVGSLVALLPSLMGTYFGVLVRKHSRNSLPDVPNPFQ
jgi:hypothetical protein